VILVVQLSSYGRDSVGRLDADTLVKHAIKAMGTCSIMDGDLHIRGTNMLSHYWNFRAHLTHFDSPGKLGISMFKNRLGASLTFDCLRRWKLEVEKARNANAAAAMAGETEQASRKNYFSWLSRRMDGERQANRSMSCRIFGRASSGPEC